MLWLPTAVLAALLAQGVVVSRPLWYGPEPQSPTLPAEGPVLDFTLQPARSGGMPTVALLAATRLPARHARVYGGRVNGAVQIVAIDLDTGGVYHAPAERPGAVPLPAVMDPDPLPQPGEATVEGIETHFNADLRAHLGLPSEPANYAVFLWLDELTSRVRLAQLPGTQGQVASQPKGTGARIALAFVGAKDRPDRVRVQATGSPEALTVMTLDYRSRALKWRRVPAPKQALKTPEGGLDLDLDGLLGPRGRLEKTFVVVSAGLVLSDVLVVYRK